MFSVKHITIAYRLKLNVWHKQRILQKWKRVNRVIGKSCKTLNETAKQTTKLTDTMIYIHQQSFKAGCWASLWFTSAQYKRSGVCMSVCLVVSRPLSLAWVGTVLCEWVCAHSDVIMHDTVLNPDVKSSRTSGAFLW